MSPLLSIIVVAYRMPRQLENTIHTLSANYQRGVDPGDYEVIVLENQSDAMLPARVRDELPSNFRYFARDEERPTPSHALASGVGEARAAHLAIMVDGAHLLTPGVVANALELIRGHSQLLVAVPVYHLGSEPQNISAESGYDEHAEAELLQSVDWRGDGYDLFRVGCWCGAHRNGFLQPLMESNCYVTSRQAFEAVGFEPSDFELPGGGAMNLHLFRKLGLQRGQRYFLLPGEGSFHQFHGGVTSNSGRDRHLEAFNRQLSELWPDGFQGLRRNPCLYGQVPPQAVQHFAESARLAIRRARRKAKLEQTLWPDDEAVELD